MSSRNRSPILSLLQFAIVGIIIWQVTRIQSSFPTDQPFGAVDGMFRAMRLIFFGGIAILALNLLYPLAAWGIGRLRERQETWEPDEPMIQSSAEAPPAESRHCPNCGASLFDDASSCPWCGHALR